MKNIEKSIQSLDKIIQEKINIIEDLKHQLTIQTERAILAEKALQPTRQSLNKMTSEYGKILRKAKRKGLNVD